MASTKSRELFGVVKDGRLPSDVQIAIRAILNRMEGKRLHVTIAEARRTRSGNQNRYYWGVVVDAVQDMFYEAGTAISPEYVHEYLKKRFVPRLIIIGLDGEIEYLPGSTADLETGPFENYLTQIRAWAAVFGKQIPLPHETRFNYSLEGNSLCQNQPLAITANPA